MKYDAAIIGGGIIGASIALEMAGRGMKVAVLERQEPGLEASWAAGGILSLAPETPDAIGLIPLARESLRLYPDFVARVESATGRSTGFRPADGIQLFFADHAARELSTLIALTHGLGVPAEAISLDDALEIEPALNPAARAAALLPGEARVDNRALTAAVLEAGRAAGVEIHAQAEVTALLLEGHRCVGVITKNGDISANHVVAAAGCWTGRLTGAERYAPTRPVRGQMVALRAQDVTLGRVVRSERGYLVPRDDGRIIAGSTTENAGFEKRVTPAGMQQILSAAVELIPALAQADVVEAWSGLRPGSPDHLPILGPTDIEGLWMATGHYRNGILLTPITAHVIAEWITSGKPPMEMDAYSPLRFRNQAASAD